VGSVRRHKGEQGRALGLDLVALRRVEQLQPSGSCACIPASRVSASIVPSGSRRRSSCRSNVARFSRRVVSVSVMIRR
jgi:hypothetical protein